VTDAQLERIVRRVLVQELRIIAAVIGGERAATAYAIASFREEQDREADQLRAARAALEAKIAPELAKMRATAEACEQRGADASRPVNAFIARLRARNLRRYITQLEKLV